MKGNTKPPDGPAIKFAKCIGCPDMGPDCLGPNLLMLSIGDLREWVRRWKTHYRLTIETCAGIWKIPEGTASRFLSDAELDFKYMTVQSIVSGIIQYGHPVGADLGDNPCPASSKDIRLRESALEEQISQLREDREQLLRDAADRDQRHIDQMADQRAGYEKNISALDDTVAFLRGQVLRTQETNNRLWAEIDRKNAELDRRREPAPES